MDLANLKYKDITGNRWFYNRLKTNVGLKNGKPLIPEALSIIENYGTKGGKDSYVFDILIGFDQNQESKTQRVLSYATYIRNACSRIAKRLDFDGHFSYYSARYSAATLALNEGADRNTISHLLDHENLSTVDNYAGRADDKKSRLLK